MGKTLQSFVCTAVLGVGLAACAPLTAYAQRVDDVGVRAQGMAGAFTAVADDSTATWWNPAGMAGGPFLSSALEYGRPKVPDGAKIQGFSMTFPSLGVSYYRLPISQMRLPATTEQVAAGR